MDKKQADNILWNSFKSGNKEALAVIFRSNYTELYRYGYKICKNASLVEDSLQELFLYLYENRKGLGNVTYIRAYLFRCFRRRLLKEIQQNSEGPVRLLPEELTVEPEEIFSIEESTAQKKVLAGMINKLPSRQRELVYLRYYENLSIREISEILSISYRSVINMLYKAMLKLRGDKSGIRKLEYLFLPVVLCCFF